MAKRRGVRTLSTELAINKNFIEWRQLVMVFQDSPKFAFKFPARRVSILLGHSTRLEHGSCNW